MAHFIQPYVEDFFVSYVVILVIRLRCKYLEHGTWQKLKVGQN